MKKMAKQFWVTNSGLIDLQNGRAPILYLQGEANSKTYPVAVYFEEPEKKIELTRSQLEKCLDEIEYFGMKLHQVRSVKSHIDDLFGKEN